MNLFNLADDKEMALAGWLTGMGSGMSRASRGGANVLGALAEGGGAGMQNMMAFQNMASMQGMRALQQEQLKRKIQADDMLRAAFGVGAAPGAAPGGMTMPMPDNGASLPPGVSGAVPMPDNGARIPPGQSATQNLPGPGGPQQPVQSAQGSASPLISMMPPEVQQQVQAIARANPEGALKLVEEYTKKLMDVGRWEVVNSPQGGGQILRDKYTGRMSEIPLTFSQQLMKARDGATRNNIQLRVDQAGSVDLAKAGVEAFKEYAGRAPTINNQLGQLKQLEAALDAYGSTGFLGEKGLQAKQLFEAMGIKTNAPAGEFFRSISTQLRLSDVPKGLTPISNYENQLLEQAAPGLSLTPEGNRTLIAAKRETLVREQQAAQILMEEMRANSQNYGEAYMRATQRIMQLGPTFSPGVDQALKNAASGNAAGAPRPNFPNDAPGEQGGTSPRRGLIYDPKVGGAR